jgi:hypothetical protein
MTPRFGFLVAAAALVLGPCAFAQQEFDNGSDEGDRIASAFDKKLESFANRFWQTRHDVYKTRIDETLNSDDLSRLNELRARFAIATERARVEREERQREYTSMNVDTTSAVMVDTAVAVSPTSAPTGYDDVPAASDSAKAMQAAEDVAPTPSNDYDGGCGGYEPTHENDTEWIERSKREMAEYEQASDLREMPAVAHYIARHYRPGMDNLAEVIQHDALRFLDSAASLANEFRRKYAVEIARNSYLDHRLKNGVDNEFNRMVRDAELFKMFYHAQLEPYVMLYSGQGLARMLGSQGLLQSNEISEESDAQIALSNSPNPVVKHTTIHYSLSETSTTGTLRVVDANGNTVLEKGLENLSAGDHEVTLDLTHVGTGNYVYQVVTRGSSGERCVSKVLQVLH